MKSGRSTGARLHRRPRRTLSHWERVRRYEAFMEAFSVVVVTLSILAVFALAYWGAYDNYLNALRRAGVTP